MEFFAWRNKIKTKQRRRSFFTALFLVLIALCSLLLAACLSTSGSVVELETKGTVMGVKTPDWVKLYIEKGLPALQANYKDRYVVVGEESGVNRQFVLAWADMASAQQRIGALIRTNIASRYQAAVSATAQSGAGDSAEYRQEINTVLSAIVNVSYSGAQREADWWSLRRRYDKDDREVYADEYTAWVLYTVPRAEMNHQIALAMETAISKDSVLYDITIALARDILLQGYDEKELQNTAFIQKTAANYYDPPGTVTAAALDEINFADVYLIGRDVAASILSRYNLYNENLALLEYLNNICQAIVLNSPHPAVFNGYHAAILDSPEVNAFASPGGHIFITRGLLEAAKSEDALAAVLAHEIAHIQLNHGLRAIQSSRDMNDWLSQFSISGAQTVADKLNAGFSRIQEFDADITALSLLAATGYNPGNLSEMLKELEKIQSGRSGGFNSTHPSPASRLVNVVIAADRYAKLPDTSRNRVKRYNAVKK